MGRDALIFEGKTLDDAVRKGLEALGLSRAEVMITMVEEGSGGFLGIGSRPYRVKVMPRPGGPIGEAGAVGGREAGGRRGRSRPERDARGRRDGRGGRAAAPESGRAPRGERSERPQRPERLEPRERTVRDQDDARVGVSERSGGGPGDRGGRRRRGQRGSPRGASGRGESSERRQPAARGPAASSPSDRPAPAEWRERPEAAAERGAATESEPRAAEEGGLSAADLAAEAKRLTELLLRHMGFDGTVTANAEADRVDVAVSLEESEELLTGGKGEVRVALQHLLNLMLNRGRRARYHLQLEINDFWQSREAELQQLARELADEAAANHSEVVTEYLNAQERRVVHVTLREDSRVKTYALGTGLIKRVAVAPADFPDQPRPEG